MFQNFSKEIKSFAKFPEFWSVVLYFSLFLKLRAVQKKLHKFQKIGRDSKFLGGGLKLGCRGTLMHGRDFTLWGRGFSDS